MNNFQDMQSGSGLLKNYYMPGPYSQRPIVDPMQEALKRRRKSLYNTKMADPMGTTEIIDQNPMYQTRRF